MLFYRRRSLGKVFILTSGDGVLVAVCCYGARTSRPTACRRGLESAPSTPHAVAATSPGPIPLVNSRRRPRAPSGPDAARAGGEDAREPNPKLGGGDRPVGTLRTTQSADRRVSGCPARPPCGLPHAEGMPQPLRFAQPCARPAAHVSARTLAASPTPRRLRGQPPGRPRGSSTK